MTWSALRVEDTAVPYSRAGTCRTKRDGGVVYTYTATWFDTDQGVKWKAVVWHEGDVVGTPHGEILGRNGMVCADLVRARVENCIENRIDVD